MRRFWSTLLLCLGLPVLAQADEISDLIRDVVQQDIVTGFEALEDATGALAEAADTSCAGPEVTSAYKAAFRSWVRVSHLRFGPSEAENRAFALAFWPDPRGKTPKALRKLLSDDSATPLDITAYRDVSIAARGFYALDYLLFDDTLLAGGRNDRYCALLRVIAADIHATASELADGWRAYAPGLITPGPETPYRTQEEVLQVLYKSARTGLQFTAEMRFGRPLGTLEKPRPRRAEAWRSGLSLTLVGEAVAGSGGLALDLSRTNPNLEKKLDNALSRFAASVTTLDDPVFAGVTTPEGRFRIEVLLTELNGIRRIVDQDLGPALGVSAGFNALDGD